MKKVIFTRLYYPGYIAVNKGVHFYIYSKAELIAVVTLVNHHLGVETVDLNSEIMETNSNGVKGYSIKEPILAKNQGVHLTKAALLSVGMDVESKFPEINIDNYNSLFHLSPKPNISKNIYFSELLIAQDYFEDKTDKHSYTQVLELFILRYREISKDINVKLPSESIWNIFGFTPNRIIENKELLNLGNVEIANISSNQFTIDTSDFRKASKPNLDITNLTINLNYLLRTENIFDTHAEIVNKVSEEIYINRNFKFALLEGFIYCEAFLTRFLRERKLSKGISIKKIEEMDVTFSYLLNIELPLFLPEFTDEWKTIIGELNWVRKKRNDVIHHGVNVSEEESVKALKSIDALLNKLDSL